MSTRAVYMWLGVLAVLVAGVGLWFAYQHYLAKAPAATSGPHVIQVNTPEQVGRAQFLQQAASASTSNAQSQTDRAQFLQTAAQPSASAGAGSAPAPTQEDRAKFLESLK